MRTDGRRLVWALVVTALLAAMPAAAESNPNGIVFRAVGWFKGKGEITSGQIKCEVPTVINAISEGAFEMGLWNTYGFQILFFPDINNPFANPCGVWLQLQNNLRGQGIILDHVQLQFRIAGASRFRQFVVTRNGFPVACRQFRKDTVFAGQRLNPVDSTQDTSVSGAPNVAFVQMLPFVSPQLLQCLRDQYSGIPTSTFVSLPLVARATAVGFSDSGKQYNANTIQYTLNLRHTCGNGRVDDGESCDPNAIGNTCIGVCQSNACSQNTNIPCTTNSDCVGTCVAPDDPSECTCLY